MERKHYLYAGVAVLFLIPLIAYLPVSPDGLVLANFLFVPRWQFFDAQTGNHHIEIFPALTWLCIFWPVLVSIYLFRKAAKEKP